VFAGNDRLAEGLVSYCRKRGRRVPALVGFDDAPIAESLGLTTIAIPWEEIARGVERVVAERLRGSQAAAVRQTFVPQPVLRSLGLGVPDTPP
ncbi:MAG: substrate-binding domain-containing protein, partial [Planctomycetota bacterium]